MSLAMSHKQSAVVAQTIAAKAVDADLLAIVAVDLVAAAVASLGVAAGPEAAAASFAAASLALALAEHTQNYQPHLYPVALQTILALPIVSG
jgi:recombinational DNA repair protein (RecF pathway)